MHVHRTLLWERKEIARGLEVIVKTVQASDFEKAIDELQKCQQVHKSNHLANAAPFIDNS